MEITADAFHVVSFGIMNKIFMGLTKSLEPKAKTTTLTHQSGLGF